MKPINKSMATRTIKALMISLQGQPLSKRSSYSRTTSAKKASSSSHTSSHYPRINDLSFPAGKPISHKFAKELLAGIVGAEIDKMAHKRRMDDREQDQTRRYAQQNAEQLYDQYYVENQGAHQYDPNQYGPPPPFWR